MASAEIASSKLPQLGEAEAVQKIQQEFPKVWLQVSTPCGSRIRESWARRFLNKAAGAEQAANVPDSLLASAVLTAARSQPAPRKARSRWALLRKALRTGSAGADGDVSVRSFSGFGLLQQSSADPCDGCNTWLWPAPPASAEVTFPLAAPPAPRVSLADLVSHRQEEAGVDNTGNVAVWPAEQVLAHCLLASAPALGRARGTLLELGGGSTCMAGVAAAHCAALSGWQVVATDGNAKAVGCAQGVWQALETAPPPAKLLIDVLQWQGIWEAADLAVQGGPGDSPARLPLAGAVDLVVAADCLFFEHVHEHLLSTCSAAMRRCSSAEGSAGAGQPFRVPCVSLAALASQVQHEPQAWLIAPQRGGSCDRFVEKAVCPAANRGAFDVICAAQFDTALSTAVSAAAEKDVQFSADLHQPLLVVLVRAGRGQGLVEACASVAQSSVEDEQGSQEASQA